MTTYEVSYTLGANVAIQKERVYNCDNEFTACAILGNDLLHGYRQDQSALHIHNVKAIKEWREFAAMPTKDYVAKLERKMTTLPDEYIIRLVIRSYEPGIIHASQEFRVF